MFGLLDLLDRTDYTRFLATHAIAMMACQTVLAKFVSHELGLVPPAFAALLRQDLTALGVAPEALPRLTLAPETDPVGLAYVILGSRLGLTVLRQRGFWGDQPDARTSAYMSDDSGLALWRGLVGWMRHRVFAEPAIEAACAGAEATFDLFGLAFAATQAPDRRAA